MNLLLALLWLLAGVPTPAPAATPATPWVGVLIVDDSTVQVEWATTVSHACVWRQRAAVNDLQLACGASGSISVDGGQILPTDLVVLMVDDTLFASALPEQPRITLTWYEGNRYLLVEWHAPVRVNVIYPDTGLTLANGYSGEFLLRPAGDTGYRVWATREIAMRLGDQHIVGRTRVPYPYQTFMPVVAR